MKNGCSLTTTLIITLVHVDYVHVWGKGEVLNTLKHSDTPPTSTEQGSWNHRGRLQSRKYTNELRGSNSRKTVQEPGYFKMKGTTILVYVNQSAFHSSKRDADTITSEASFKLPCSRNPFKALSCAFWTQRWIVRQTVFNGLDWYDNSFIEGSAINSAAFDNSSTKDMTVPN